MYHSNIGHVFRLENSNFIKFKIALTRKIQINLRKSETLVRGEGFTRL